MADICATPYKTWAPIYRDLGMWPRPIIGKKPRNREWQFSNEELPEGTIEKWMEEKADYNIGLTMGSPLPDGTLLGALDIDHDSYVGLGRVLLRNPKCGRFGKKGIVFFFRYPKGLETPKKIRSKGKDEKSLGDVAEVFLQRSLIAIPPSIHPETQQPYRWVGTPLHEIAFNDLPLIGE